MKCAFDHCLKTANPGLFGSVVIGRAKISFPLCMAHWNVIGKLQKKFEGTKKVGGKQNGKKR